MRDSSVRGILVYYADYRCSHSIALSADRWADDIRLSDSEPRFYLLGLRQARGGRAAGLQLEGRTRGDDGFQLASAQIFVQLAIFCFSSTFSSRGTPQNGTECRNHSGHFVSPRNK